MEVEDLAQAMEAWSSMGNKKVMNLDGETFTVMCDKKKDWNEDKAVEALKPALVEDVLKEKDRVIKNPHIHDMDEDILYHFALSTKSHDLKRMFGDVKFVCIGGSSKRMEYFAHFMLKELGYNLPAGTTLENIARATDRYAMFKVGPVLSISHGMGIPSVSIMLHEIIKLINHAGCKDVVFFRLGTCGGLGVEGGTVIISEQAVDSLSRPFLELTILGKLVQRPAEFDRELVKELISLNINEVDFDIISGTTMCTYDFYEEQGRLDGAFCDYTEEDKLEFMQDVYQQGIRNFEMESLCFAALCQHAGIKCACICVSLLNRLKSDQIKESAETMSEWSERPQRIVAGYIRHKLGLE